MLWLMMAHGLLRGAQVNKDPLVSQDLWAPLDLPGRVAWDTLDLKAHLGLPDLLATPQLASLALQVLQGNQVLTACLVKRGILAHLGPWVQEDPQVPLEAQDPLDSLLLASLAHTVCLEPWGQGVSPDLKDTQVSLAHKDQRERRGILSLGQQGQSAQSAQPVNLEGLVNPELVSLVPLDTLASLESQVPQVGMVHQDPWGCQG
ncbi:hypothetical protein UPYG_G00250930 [Umbra pygmaea]|uniref:Uncharacterized protein n=1 Tax=Umbra pygmaea TaxID=75934 RepID=A0ABD0WSS7_UMBPY